MCKHQILLTGLLADLPHALACGFKKITLLFPGALAPDFQFTIPDYLFQNHHSFHGQVLKDFFRNCQTVFASSNLTV